MSYDISSVYGPIYSTHYYGSNKCTCDCEFGICHFGGKVEERWNRSRKKEKKVCTCDCEFGICYRGSDE